MDRQKRWSELCLDEGVEQLILARIERSGLCAHLRSLVQREVEKVGVQEHEVQATVFKSLAAKGTRSR